VTDLSEPSDDEPMLDLLFLLRSLLRRWMLITACTFLGTVFSTIYSLTQTELYEASMLLAPEDSQLAPSTAALSGAGMGVGLAELAGLTVGLGGGGNKIQIALAKMESFHFFKENLYDLVSPAIFAGGYWDKSTGGLGYNVDLYDASRGIWLQSSAKPTPQKAYREFSKTYEIDKTDARGLISVKMEHVSPHVAKEWLQHMLDRINDTIRQNDIGNAKESIDFLMREKKNNTFVEIDQTLNDLLEQNMNLMVVAQTRESYVFDLIEPPFASMERVYPVRKIMVLIGSVAGFLIGIAIVLAMLLVPRLMNMVRED
jgi:LPS O-antigen subunit length determinant protein (WzzB/FepE family)